MTNTVLSSTFFLTLLLLVGLFFFIRAATKDRTETLELTVGQNAEAVRTQLQTYFEQRAYQVTAADSSAEMTLTGLVRPSVFLALFIALMAAIAAGCLGLVLAILFPAWAYGFGALLLIAPAAGAFYWRRAGRQEQVRLKVEASDADSSSLTVVAHRDELIALKQKMAL